MYKPTLTLALLATAVAAESYTTTLLILGSGGEPAIGSVVTSDATATTYSLTCAPSQAPAGGCGYPTSFHYTQGPSTMHIQIPMYGSDPNPATIDIQCQITGSGGHCTQAEITSGTTSVHATTSYGNFATVVGVQAVVITDGPLPAASSGTDKISPTSATSTASSTAGETTSSDSSTKVSTGGIPMITVRPQWMVGGVAVAAAAIAGM